MRLLRSSQKPAIPRRSTIICANSPAMKKNRHMRKVCVVNTRVLITALGWLSTVAQMPGNRPGMNENPPWSRMPSSSATARTASRECRRSVRDMTSLLDEIPFARGKQEPESERDDAQANFDGEDRNLLRIPHRLPAPEGMVHRGHGHEKGKHEIDRDIA